LRLGWNQARAGGLTIPARAVPLGQTTARGGAKDADANSNSDDGLAANLGRVGRAFHRNAHVLHLGFDPRFFVFGVFHGTQGQYGLSSGKLKFF
jgi:hypothetical protein